MEGLIPVSVGELIDKLFTVPIGDIGSSIGCPETTVMAELDLALRDWLALY